MNRIFRIPGIIFLFIAFVLSFLTSISAPSLPALDIVRVHTERGPQAPLDVIREIRFGIWAPCVYLESGTHVCDRSGHGYSLLILGLDGSSTTIGSSWTRGLAIHPVATAAIFVALCLSFSSHVTVTLAASLVSFLAALLTFLAFIIDIALYAYVHHKVGDLTDNANTDTAPGFWLTFVSLLFTLFAGCTVCFGRRREADSTSSYPMMSNPSKGFLARFQKN